MSKMLANKIPARIFFNPTDSRFDESIRKKLVYVFVKLVQNHVKTAIFVSKTAVFSKELEILEVYYKSSLRSPCLIQPSFL